jgi:uncharacterized membrane protein
MELLMVLAVGYFILCPIYLSIRVHQLGQEIKQIRREQGTLVVAPSVAQVPPAPMTAMSPTPAYTPAPTTPMPAYAPQPSGFSPQFTSVPTASVATSDEGFDLTAWLKKDFLVKLGALLLLIGFGWFLSYAFENGLIGPMGQISLGILAGVVAMIVGVWRLPFSIHQGGTFAVLGSGIVLMTVYSARLIYDFFTPTTALLTMFMSIALVAFVAVRARSQNIAIIGLLMGAVTPLLTYTPEPSTMGLFAYLAVLVLGSIWVMFRIQAESLLFVALLIVFFYGAPYMEGGLNAESMLALLWSFGFTLIFFLGSLVSLLNRTSAQAHGMHLLTATGTGLYLASWISTVAPEAWQAPLYAMWMLVFAVGAFFVFRATNDRVPFYIYSAVSIGLLGAATAALLEGSVLTIALILEVSMLVALGASLTKDQKVTGVLSTLFIFPIILSLGNIISSSWDSGFVHTDLFVLLTLVAGLLLSAQAVREQYRLGTFTETSTADVLSSFAGGYLVLLVWLMTHSALDEDVATFVSLVIYTIAGMSLYVRGVTVSSYNLKVWGGILIGLVVGRLLLIDVWEMEIGGRIVTFFVIGLLLISTAFMRKFNPK